jgi:hypothetical protein
MIEVAWLPEPHPPQLVRLPYCFRCWAPLGLTWWRKARRNCWRCLRPGKTGPPSQTRCTRCRITAIPPKAERRWRHAMCEPCFRTYRAAQREKRRARLE